MALACELGPFVFQFTCTREDPLAFLFIGASLEQNWS